MKPHERLCKIFGYPIRPEMLIKPGCRQYTDANKSHAGLNKRDIPKFRKVVSQGVIANQSLAEAFGKSVSHVIKMTTDKAGDKYDYYFSDGGPENRDIRQKSIRRDQRCCVLSLTDPIPDMFNFVFDAVGINVEYTSLEPYVNETQGFVPLDNGNAYLVFNSNQYVRTDTMNGLVYDYRNVIQAIPDLKAHLVRKEDIIFYINEHNQIVSWRYAANSAIPMKPVHPQSSLFLAPNGVAVNLYTKHFALPKNIVELNRGKPFKDWYVPLLESRVFNTLREVKPAVFTLDEWNQYDLIEKAVLSAYRTEFFKVIDQPRHNLSELIASYF